MEAHWYFDFSTPFSYLQLGKVREWRSRLRVTPVPISTRALLRYQHDVRPDASGMSESATRFIKWRAKTAGIALNFPSEYPFNAVAALRLCIAAGSTWPAVEEIFGHIWRDGRNAASTADLADVGISLGLTDVDAAIKSADTGTQLRLNTESAIAIGVRGAPCMRVGSELFWGSDAAQRLDEWLAHGGGASDLRLKVGW